MQNHCPADLWKESNSVSAVISVLWWVCGHIGCLHIWCDNEVVVSHFKELQQGLATPECFEHADLWRQVQMLLREATVELLINKVYSHVESASQSPMEDFCRIWNNRADHQAELANIFRGFGSLFVTIGIFGNNESSSIPVL